MAEMTFRGVWWTDLFEWYLICENCYYKQLAEGGEMWTGSTGDRIHGEERDDIIYRAYAESEKTEKCEWCKGPREAYWGNQVITNCAYGVRDPHLHKPRTDGVAPCMALPLPRCPTHKQILQVDEEDSSKLDCPVCGYGFSYRNIAIYKVEPATPQEVSK